MKALNKKLGKNGGFTLIEMLIVVAIIAILVAISIPLINNALERARDATDQANERAAKAEAVLLYMGVAGDATYVSGTHDGKYYYNAASGALEAVPATGTPTGYGKCTGGHSGTSAPTFLYPTTAGGTDLTGANKHTNGYLLLDSISTDGVVKMHWVVPA